MAAPLKLSRMTRRVRAASTGNSPSVKVQIGAPASSLDCQLSQRLGSTTVTVLTQKPRAMQIGSPTARF